MDGTVTLGALGSITTISGFGFAILNQLRKNRRENDTDRKTESDELKTEFAKVQSNLSERLLKVETVVPNFMYRTEIEAKLEHEKSNRQQVDESLRLITERLNSDVRGIMVTQGRIEAQQQSTAGTVNEIKDTLKELSREITGRFDKVATSISELSNKVQH